MTSFDGSQENGWLDPDDGTTLHSRDFHNDESDIWTCLEHGVASLSHGRASEWNESESDTLGLEGSVKIDPEPPLHDLADSPELSNFQNLLSTYLHPDTGLHGQSEHDKLDPPPEHLYRPIMPPISMSQRPDLAISAHQHGAGFLSSRLDISKMMNRSISPPGIPSFFNGIGRSRSLPSFPQRVREIGPLLSSLLIAPTATRPIHTESSSGTMLSQDELDELQDQFPTSTTTVTSCSVNSDDDSTQQSTSPAHARRQVNRRWSTGTTAIMMPPTVSVSPPPSDSTSPKPQRSYPCKFENCGRIYMSRSSLSKHKQTHSGTRPCVCDVEGCGRSYAISGHLARHKKTHSEIRSFACEEPGCDRKFHRSDELNKHMTVHSGGRMFECEVEGCGKRFSWKCSLKRHRDSFHGS
jgi:uncharacterized Zn-finger protein